MTGMNSIWQTSILRALSQVLGDYVLHNLRTLAASVSVKTLLTGLTALRVISGLCGYNSH